MKAMTLSKFLVTYSSLTKLWQPLESLQYVNCITSAATVKPETKWNVLNVTGFEKRDKMSKAVMGMSNFSKLWQTWGRARGARVRGISPNGDSAISPFYLEKLVDVVAYKGPTLIGLPFHIELLQSSF